MCAHGGGRRADRPRLPWCVPSGHEFNSFVLGLYNVAGPGQPLGDDLIDRSRSITDPLDIMVLVSLTCTMCPETVLASQRIASLNPAVRAEAYDVALPRA